MHNLHTLGLFQCLLLPTTADIPTHFPPDSSSHRRAGSQRSGGQGGRSSSSSSNNSRPSLGSPPSRHCEERTARPAGSTLEEVRGRCQPPLATPGAGKGKEGSRLVILAQEMCGGSVKRKARPTAPGLLQPRAQPRTRLTTRPASFLKVGLNSASGVLCCKFHSSSPKSELCRGVRFTFVGAAAVPEESSSRSLPASVG
jgi:hypothetical protein